jgi:hypothetical protein
VRRWLLVAALGTAAATAIAQRPVGFSYDPQPRWTQEQETETVCEAIARECAGQQKDGAIEANWRYAEYYDADGFLVGLKSLQSTGCKPLDEHMLLGHRHFATVFSKDGAPDLDALKVETAAGIDRNGVRIVKQGETSVSFGC